MFRSSGKIAGLRWLLACVSFFAAGACLAGPYELTFQAFRGTAQTQISIAISAAPGFTLPAVADKLSVKSIDTTSGEALVTKNYFSLPLTAGQATVVFPETPANAALSVQVNFKTPDAARTWVLRADAIVISQMDLAIEGVTAPAQVCEVAGSCSNPSAPTLFNVVVAVSELSGSAGAQFDVQIMSSQAAVTGSVTGVSIAAGGIVNVVVPTSVSILGNDGTRTFTAVLTNITPTDAIAANNSIDFTMLVLCSFEHVDCGN